MMPGLLLQVAPTPAMAAMASSSSGTLAPRTCSAQLRSRWVMASRGGEAETSPVRAF